jgi:hypothetical protein
LLLGQAWVDLGEGAAQDFLIVRNLKLVQAHACTFSRLAPVDLWPVLAAFLSLFAPDWQPQGLDARRFQEARAKLQPVVPAHFDDDLPALALEVIGGIGSRASQLGTALHQWANRTALLAVGSPSVALLALASQQSQPALPPTGGPDRARWIARHAEARDVLVFSVSEAYLEARKRFT